MTTLLIQTEQTPLIVSFPALVQMTDKQLYEFCQANRDLRIERTATGEVFDSSAGFTLPNGATRSPDASWIRLERWNALTDEQKASFAPICPDFVIELRSASDSLSGLQAKMQEYINNGAVLGFLIDRKNGTVHVYRPGRSPEILEQPERVSGDPELSEFVLRMEKIW